MRKFLQILLILVFYVGVIGGGIALIVYNLCFAETPNYKHVARIAGVLVVYLIAILQTSHKQKKATARANVNNFPEIIRDAFSDDQKHYKQLMTAVDYFNKDELKRAQKILNRLIPQCSTNNEYVAVMSMIGLCWREDEVYWEMKKAFEEVLKRDATNNIAWSNIALAYLEMDQYQKTIDACKQAIRFDAKDAYSYSNMAQAYMRLGQAEQAVESALKSIELDSAQIEAMACAALAYKMLNDIQHSEQYYKMYLLNGGEDAEEIQEMLEKM